MRYALKVIFPRCCLGHSLSSGVFDHHNIHSTATQICFVYSARLNCDERSTAHIMSTVTRQLIKHIEKRNNEKNMEKIIIRLVILLLHLSSECPGCPLPPAPLRALCLIALWMVCPARRAGVVLFINLKRLSFAQPTKRCSIAFLL